jgi:hypothetical protein
VTPLLVAAGIALAAAAGPGVDRVASDPRITESSGLAVSAAHPGVLWTHDDSGNPPLLFALGRSGAVTATVRITGVPDVDWEAMAAFRDGTGRPLLAAADIGDNAARRDSVEVDVVPEPDPLRSVSAGPLLRLRLTYPDGPRDAETLIVDTTRRRMFVVSKGLLTSTVYLVPREAWDGAAPARAEVRSARLVPVGTVPLTLVTDGTVASSGAVLLRTYSDLAVLDPFPLDEGGRVLAPRSVTSLPSQPQGEGLALAPDGRSVLVSSEGAGQDVLRVPLPDDVLSAIGTSPSPAPAQASPRASRTSSASPPGSAAPGSAAPGSGSARAGASSGPETAGAGTSSPGLGLPALGTAALLLLLAGAVALSRRGRR